MKTKAQPGVAVLHTARNFVPLMQSSTALRPAQSGSATPQIAAHTEDAILRGEKLGHYRLDAYVVMPNHVHVLLLPRVPLARITGGIKGVSARDANVALGRVGQHFWQDESYDHWARNEAELESIRQYIERNPVIAGLVERPEDWPWSSARRRSK